MSLLELLDEDEKMVCVQCGGEPGELPYVDDWRVVQFGFECPGCSPESIAADEAQAGQPAALGVLQLLAKAIAKPPTQMRPRVQKRFKRT